MLFKFLEACGPFTTPLCAFMGYAVLFLVRALDRMEKRAVASERDATALRDRRADELVEMGREMADAAEATRNVLREHNERIDRLIARAAGSTK